MASGDVPEAFQCPITQDLMTDPVMDQMGHNFEKESITAWLVRHQTCPMGREPLSLDKLYPNRTLKQQITEWQRTQGGGGGAAQPTASGPPPSGGGASRPPAPTSTSPPRPAPAAPAPPPQFNPNTPWTKYGMTQEEYDRAMCMFLTFDEDSSGELDRRELTRLARYMNYPNTPSDIAKMFQLMDTNRSGTLDLDEFLTYMKDKRPKPEVLYGLSQVMYEQFMMQFHDADADQDGELSPSELMGLCQRMGYPLARDQVNVMFQAIDANRSGTLDAHEFLTYMRFNDPRRPCHLPAPPGFEGPPISSGAPPQNNSNPYPPPPPHQASPYPPPPPPAAQGQYSSYPPPLPSYPAPQPQNAYGNYPPPHQSNQYPPPPAAYGPQPSYPGSGTYGSGSYQSGQQPLLQGQRSHGRHGQQENCTIS